MGRGGEVPSQGALRVVMSYCFFLLQACLTAQYSAVEVLGEFLLDQPITAFAFSQLDLEGAAGHVLTITWPGRRIPDGVDRSFLARTTEHVRPCYIFVPHICLFGNNSLEYARGSRDSSLRRALGQGIPALF
jgi:hypothetical protein